MNLSLLDYFKISLFVAAFFMVFKFGLRQTQELDHFADTF